jgi:tRNA A37 N6-isopentenylltransferase MiaA
MAEMIPTDGQKVLREEMDRLHAEIANLQIMDEVSEKLLADYEAEIEQLNSDIIGYRAVISYLQGQLDGATV